MVFTLNIEQSSLISSKSLYFIPSQKSKIGFLHSGRLNLCFVGHWSTRNIDDHGSRPGNTSQTLAQLSWKCRRFRCRPQLVLTICLHVFLSCRPDTADVSATSCDVGYFFSVSYVVSLPNCRHVVVVYVDRLRFIC